MPNGKRIVLTTLGSFGDIHPYMAIAMELQARGHRSVIATSGLYQEKIEAAGLDFLAVSPNLAPPQEQDERLMEKIMEPARGPKFLLEEVIFPHVRESYADLLKAVEGADLLITHPITFAGPLVAHKTGIPWVSTVLAPMSFLSAYDPPVPPFWSWLLKLRVFGPTFLTVFFGFLKSRYRPKRVDSFRMELGLPDLGNPVFEGQHSPTLVLALFSRLFAAPQPDWPSQTQTTGFAFYDGKHELQMPRELSRFLDEGPPPVVFTLGTSAVWIARDFYRESIAAARALGRRAVLLIGDQRNLPPEVLPEEIIAIDYAPFEALLSRACAVVHHGGVGTTSQGLRSGTPTLIVPFAFDQADNAAHAARLGTSRTLARNRYSASRVARELNVLLTKPEYAKKAQAVGQQLRSENGAAVASDLIEEVLSRTQAKEGEEEPAYAPRN